ncbi:NifU family protein [Cecembia rubra]|uniref:Fe-S cluster biogenesis protein NfuA n=1 Tax=Cecembia rubra TaxID=1485585 RepID=A0A2P8ECV3_9BACT|nr:NifU family protein [Cecembia rubra]PSL07291.1 Fe-S cluster biogenesis protein NfuA [Cecembia rubra]
MEMELIDRIERALNNIRPYLEADGGNVKIVEVTSDMVLKLELTGTCSSCPMSTMTLKAGVEEAIKRDVPEIIKVEAVNVAVV